MSLCSFVFQKCSKVSYAESPTTLHLISGWLGVFDADILHISISGSCCGLSGPSLLLEIESFAYLNLIILESQFQKP